MHFRGVSRSPSDLHWAGRKVIVPGFPIGIEPEDFREKMETEGVKRELAKLRKNFEGQKIILGVDRLDYIKGIPQKLRAFDRFLTEHPEWVGKVTLIQLAIPTRAEVTTYQRLREEVESLVGHVNGKHGRFPSLSCILEADCVRYILFYTNPLSVPVCEARTTVCTLCRLGCLHHLIHPRWPQHGELRIHRLPEQLDGRGSHDVLLRWCCQDTPLLPCHQSVGHSTIRKCDRGLAEYARGGAQAAVQGECRCGRSVHQVRTTEAILDAVMVLTPFSVRWGTTFLNTLYRMHVPSQEDLPDPSEQMHENDRRQIKSAHLLQERSRSRGTSDSGNPNGASTPDH